VAGAAVAAAAWLGGAPAAAHELQADALPPEPGWRLGAAAAVVAPGADARWPQAAWPGVLVNGSAPRDQRRGLRLEHATLDAALRLPALRAHEIGLHLAAGWHDRETAHLEAARLVLRRPLGDDQLQLVLGRDTVPLGATLTAAGHFDRFSQPPVAKRALLNDQWIDDGATLSWLGHADQGLQRIGLGLWRGRSFPGGAGGPIAASLQAEAAWQAWRFEAAVAHWAPTGRGAAAQTLGNIGHVHGSLDCRRSLQQRVCFDGEVTLLGAAARWQSADGRWQLGAAGLAKRERGSLASTNALADLRGDLAGAWADAAWLPRPGWVLAARAERLQNRHALTGAGAGQLARDAGLLGAAPVERFSLAVLNQPFARWPQWQWALEAGTEQSGAGRASHLALRLVWRDQALWAGRW